MMWKRRFFMYTTKQNNTAAGNIKLFGNIRVLIIAALLIAMSAILGKFIAFGPMPFARISIENLPVILAGIWFGPFVGGAVGLGADLFGCVLKGYAPNPILTIGFVSIGIVAGLVSTCMHKANKPLVIILSDAAAHIIGSLIIKTIGLYAMYCADYSLSVLLAWRIPIYIITIIFESAIIILLMRNKAFTGQLDKVCNYGKQRRSS